ncbi:hypothetical protein [Sphingobacterium multivorum]|uniref:hypothetical protein n=1 Tax=Sphingobacterium multivorum TaxID=28454 RepID=UPI003DA33FCA
MENTREQKLKYGFGSHPSVKEFHVTSDDQMFLNAGDANNHAKNLEDKEVKVELRSDYLKSTVDPAPDNQLDLEKEALREKHNELFGNYPNANAGLDKIKEKIKIEEDRLAALADKEANDSMESENSESGNESDSPSESVEEN